MRLPISDFRRTLLILGSLAALGATHLAEAQDLRLSRNVVPVFQAVQLRIDADQTDYTGSVDIEIEVAEPTATFPLHAEEMEIQEISLHSGTGTVDVEFRRLDEKVIELQPSKPLAAGKYTLSLSFAAPFGTKATGLYRMEHEGQGYVFTQFEADDAREAFPCFDEPGFKFPWQLTLEVPEKHLSVTNTPVESSSVSDGWTKTVYQRTKPLPSYLIAIAAGPLETVPIPNLDVPGKVVTVKGQSHLAGLAIETTGPILREVEKYFDAKYPYEKLDLIAIPEYWPGAMEHPGAVTFAARLLLIDPKAASTSQKRTLARVMAHELAHMWFGNLVTMQWWDDLWLNESFADWMGDKIANRVYPQYNLDVTELQSVLGVMTGDARPSAMAIQRPIESTDRLMENVGVAYNKGKAVLAMFEHWIGEENFRRGVLRYLEKHKWGNATADDLWTALNEASDQNITAAMATFITQPGLPVVSVEAIGDNQIRLRQRRFANYGITQPQEYHWKIPVSLRYSDGRNSSVKSVLLEEAETTVQLDTGGKPLWVLPNADQRGYYIWDVPKEMLAELAQGSKKYLNERERVAFIGNLSALLDAGLVSGDDFLYALSEFADDPKPQVISALMGALGKVEMAFVPEELTEPFAHYVRRALGPALERFGMEAQPGEEEEVGLFRPQLLSWLGDRGRDDAIVAKAKEMAQAYLEDTSSIDASLASVALRLSAMEGDYRLFVKYKNLFEATEVPADRSRYLSALGSFRDPAIQREALRYTLKGPLRTNELFRIPMRIMQDAAGRDMAFDWFLKHYDDFAERLPDMFMGFMPAVASGCSAERLELARVFFSEPEHQAAGTETQLAKVTDQVNDCVGLREREGEAVARYLRDQVSSR